MINFKLHNNLMEVCIFTS